MTRGRALALTAATTVAVLVVDQVVKALVRGSLEVGERRDVLGDALRLVHVENDGVAFGRLSGSPVLVALIVSVALVALLVFVGTHLDVPGIWLPTGMLLGGAIGNVVDRVARGSVTDYIKASHWPAFNAADVSITLGVVLLLVVVERDARRRDRAGAVAEAGDGAPGPA
ncbi:MAG TPA: signal peptidase II [Solirubrobacteraceae bacterium]|nr:signal peptidase II [Solirubrobacteraceae bacterium]